MQIEYKIKFQEDGFTITESIDSEGTGAPVKPGAPIAQNSLGANIQESQAAAAASTFAQGSTQSASPIGGTQGNRPRGGTPVTESGSPITIIGPFIFLCRPGKPEGNDGK